MPSGGGISVTIDDSTPDAKSIKGSRASEVFKRIKSSNKSISASPTATKNLKLPEGLHVTKTNVTTNSTSDTDTLALVPKQEPLTPLPMTPKHSTYSTARNQADSIDIISAKAPSDLNEPRLTRLQAPADIVIHGVQPVISTPSRSAENAALSKPAAQSLQVKNHKCQYCTKRLPSFRGLKHHTRQKHPDKPMPEKVDEDINRVHQCQMCEKTFFTRKSLTKHWNKKHKGQPVPEVKAQKTQAMEGPRPEDLDSTEVSMLEVSMSAEYLADQSITKSEVGQSIEGMEIPGETVGAQSGGAGYSSGYSSHSSSPETVNEGLSDMSWLENMTKVKKHQKGDKPYTCQLCGKAYGFLSQLKQHVHTCKAKKRKSSGHGSTKKPRKSGNGEIGQIKCSECPKKFSDEQARLKHVMVHRRASIKLSRFSSRSGH